MNTPTLLFVYGTLRRGSGSLMGERLASEATWVGDATVSGALYDMGPFPALVASDDAGERVHGEVWSMMPDRAEALIAMLDQYEGFAPDARFGSLFLRLRTVVRFDDGSEQQAWMYAYNMPPENAPRIPGGDWLKR